MRVEVEEAWYEVGRWDSLHGLMPMASWRVPPQASHAYTLGYKSSGKLGIEINTHPHAKRPHETRRAPKTKAQSKKP